jgi:hypothetical protein
MIVAEANSRLKQLISTSRSHIGSGTDVPFLGFEYDAATAALMEITLQHAEAFYELANCDERFFFSATSCARSAMEAAVTLAWICDPKDKIEKEGRWLGYRCMICGQRPADDVNIQLHAHHIRPYGKSGVTIEKNLISLCHTCHAGLEPHYEYTLFELIENKSSDSAGRLKQRKLKEYIRSVQSYRNSVRALLDPFDKVEGQK